MFLRLKDNDFVNWEVNPQGYYQTTACCTAKYDLLSIYVFHPVLHHVNMLAN